MGSEMGRRESTYTKKRRKAKEESCDGQDGAEKDKKYSVFNQKTAYDMHRSLVGSEMYKGDMCLPYVKQRCRRFFLQINN